jgi:hypothetical protein
MPESTRRRGQQQPPPSSKRARPRKLAFAKPILKQYTRPFGRAARNTGGYVKSGNEVLLPRMLGPENLSSRSTHRLRCKARSKASVEPSAKQCSRCSRSKPARHVVMFPACIPNGSRAATFTAPLPKVSISSDPRTAANISLHRVVPHEQRSRKDTTAKLLYTPRARGR